VPPPMIIQLSLEMIKMMLHPVRHSRGVIDLINGYQEVLTKFMQADPLGATMRPPGPPPGAPPPRGTNGQKPPQAQPGQGLPPGLGPHRSGPPPQPVTRPS